jgi:hypothetical protein
MTLRDAAKVRALVRRICVCHEQIHQDQQALDKLMAEICGFPRPTLERTRQQLDELLTSLTDDEAAELS